MLERDTEHKANAPALRVGIVEISQTAHVLYVENLKDIVHTNNCLYVWRFGIHRGGQIAE